MSNEDFIVNPTKIRGLGNIVSPKTLDSFDVMNTVLSAGTDSVDGVSLTVYTAGYRTGSVLSKTGDGFVLYTESLVSMPVVCTLEYKAGTVITGASVSCIVNEETTLTGSTDSSGNVTFNVPFSEGVSYYNLRFKYNGTSSVGGCSVYGLVIVGSLAGLTLTGETGVMQSGDTDLLTATLTGSLLDDSVIGVQGETVNFYELYTPTTLNLISDKSVMQSGDTATLTATLHDEDGSLIQGETVNFYRPMKGTDFLQKAIKEGASVVEWTNYQNYIDNETFETPLYISHGGYLDVPWSNEGNWCIEFDYQYSKPYYIGLLICSADINPYEDSKLANYGIATWEGKLNWGGLGWTSWSKQPDSVPVISQTSTHHYSITKLSGTRLRFELDETYVWEGEYPNLPVLDELYLGTRDNPANRNIGGEVAFQNIHVEED